MPRTPEDQRLQKKLDDPSISPKTRAMLEDRLESFKRRKMGYGKRKHDRDAVSQYREEIGKPPKPYDETQPIIKGDLICVSRGHHKNKVGIVEKIDGSTAWCKLQGVDGLLSFTKSSIAKHVYA